MTIHKSITLILFLLICSVIAIPALADGLNIVCTDFPCYDFARAVALPEDNITLLIKPGQEVHTYEPTPADILSIQSADLFLYIGGESDSWIDGILSSVNLNGKSIRMMDEVQLYREEVQVGMQAEAEAEEDAYDEHIWTDPQNAALMVSAISMALQELDPIDGQIYSENAAAYIREIEDLDTAFEAIVESALRREVIFGDRFPFLYFVRRYGLSYYAAFPGCSSASEPSAQTIAFLIDRVREDGVSVVYQLELSNGKIAQAIANETGAEVCTMYSCQTISLDDFETGETYVSLMLRNLDALERGLN